jgi:hypothetical protein
MRRYKGRGARLSTRNSVRESKVMSSTANMSTRAEDERED